MAGLWNPTLFAKLPVTFELNKKNCSDEHQATEIIFSSVTEILPLVSQIADKKNKKITHRHYILQISVLKRRVLTVKWSKLSRILVATV